VQKETEEKNYSREKVWDEPFVAMCKGLDAYGPREILNLLVENARQDEVIHQLLVQFPTVVSLSEFLHTLPVIKVNKRTLKRLEKSRSLL
jgi:hypothetical protein